MKYDFIDKNKLTDIADAIREQNGEEDKYKLSEMPDKILDLSSLKIINIEVKTPPTKTAYKPGEAFDSTGMEIIANTENGWQITLNDYTYQPEIIDNDNTTITISFVYNREEYTCQQEVRIGHIYGVYWDGSETTKWTRTDDSADFEDPISYVAGAEEYGSPFDNLLPWSGMVRVSDEDAGELVAIPKFWYKWTRDGDSMLLQIADYPEEGFYCSPAHSDREDGNGERDIVYIGRYHCSTSDYKSTSGVKPKNNLTIQSARLHITALGKDIYQEDFYMWWTINMLYLVEYADWNDQATLGYGQGSLTTMGYTDDMPYHTGTTLDNKETYGCSLQYRYIEGIDDNGFIWIDGIWFQGTNVYCAKNPLSYYDSYNGFWIKVGSRITSGGYISAWSVPEVEGFEFALLPSAVKGSSSTYITTYFNAKNSSHSNSQVEVMTTGGCYQPNVDQQNRGIIYMNTMCLASDTNEYRCCRLMKLPNNK